MNQMTVILVRLPEAARELAQKAAREVWPRAHLVTARTVAEAAQAPATGRELLVLGAADESDVGLAAQTLDAADLPRWAVVCLGSFSSELAETVAPEDWNLPVLARVFRYAQLQHELLRENLQLRGDLKTVARRVSHDARTPIGCIHTVCELLRDVPPENAASLAESTDIIRNATVELSDLVDRVSFMIRASIDPVPPTIFGMGLAVDAALKQLQPELESSGKKVRQPAGGWPEVEGVLAWTETIWWNLLRNAITHGRSGPIQLGWTRENGAIRCWVSSAGVVPASTQPRLFRRFHQLHQQPGGGLGLSLAQRLVTLQGGQIGYEATEDNRALFFFTVRGVPALKESGPRQASLAGSHAS